MVCVLFCTLAYIWVEHTFLGPKAAYKRAQGENSRYVRKRRNNYQKRTDGARTRPEDSQLVESAWSPALSGNVNLRSRKTSQQQKSNPGIRDPRK